jgi:hypothetical protein
LPNIPKDFKRTFAVKLDELFLATIESLYLAGYSEKESKLVVLNKTVAKINRLKFLLMLAWEIRGLTNKKYIALSEKINEAGKMLGGWLTHIENKNSRLK